MTIKNPCKILYVIGSLGLGGSEMHLSQLLPRLDPKKFEPMVYILSEDDTLASNFCAQNIPVINGCKFSKFFHWLPRGLKGSVIHFLNIIQLIFFIKQKKITVIHAFLPMATVIAGFACIITRHPCFIVSRRSLGHYRKNHRIMSIIESWLMRYAKVVLGNSLAVLNDLRTEGVSDRKLALIYNGVDIDRLQESRTAFEIRQAENIDPETVILLIVANLLPYKGHLDLFNALNLLKDSLTCPWILLCVGGGKDYSIVLQQQVLKLGLSDNIRFMGPRHNVAALYKISDIGLLVSHEEGFSNSLLEGMVCGLPAIVTGVGGNIEAVSEAVNGYIVPPNNPVALSLAIKELVHNPQLRESMGDEAKKIIKKKFSMGKMIEKYEKLYSICLEIPKIKNIQKLIGQNLI